MTTADKKKKVEKPTLKKSKEQQEEKREHGGARDGAGRPAFEPTDKERTQVQAMAGYGIPQEQIAILVRDGIHIETLRTHFKNELVLGKAKANLQVGQTLFQKAISGDTTSAIWWSKTQMGWKETQLVEYPTGIPVHMTASNLTDDQLAAVIHGDYVAD